MRDEGGMLRQEHVPCLDSCKSILLSDLVNLQAEVWAVVTTCVKHLPAPDTQPATLSQLLQRPLSSGTGACCYFTEPPVSLWCLCVHVMTYYARQARTGKVLRPLSHAIRSPSCILYRLGNMPNQQAGNTGSSDEVDCVGSNRWVSLALPVWQQPTQGVLCHAQSQACDTAVYLRGQSAYRPTLSYDLYTCRLNHRREKTFLLANSYA